MEHPALALVAAVLLLGCEAAMAPAQVPSVEIAAPAPPPAPEGDVPFKGVFSRYAHVASRSGRRFHSANDHGTGTLSVEPGKVTYEQRFTSRGEPVRIAQVYTFGSGDVQRVGDEAYEVALTFQSLDGDARRYSADAGSPRLTVRRRGSGWHVGLHTVDARDTTVSAAFGIESPEDDRLSHMSASLSAGPPDVAAAPPDALRTPSGLATRVLSPGDGTVHPGPSDRVKVHYSAWTPNGEMFDSSYARGEPMSLPLDKVIKGWTEGVALMVTGEKRRLWIPSALAYGDHPPEGAPSGDVVYDIELLDITRTPPAPPVPEDVKAPPASARKTRSGLAYRILKKSTGTRSPKPTSRVRVHYSGWTTDGRLFDSSITRGAPMSLGVDQVVPGWTEGLQLMKEGEVARFWIPALLAYGDKPSRAGAPAGMLVFDIELISIE